MYIFIGFDFFFKLIIVNTIIFLFNNNIMIYIIKQSKFKICNKINEIYLKIIYIFPYIFTKMSQ